MIRGIVLGLAVTLCMAVRVHGQQPSPAPDVGIDQRLNEQLPLQLIFRDENGMPVALEKYFGKRPVILVLAYYRCPRLCSMVLNGLTESLQKIDYDLGRQYDVVTVSVDPRETSELAAAKKAACVAQYGRPGTEAGWHFLTGDEAAIKSLASAVGFRYAYDPKLDQFAHASGIMVLTPQGKIARYFYGIAYVPRDVRFGLEDASAGKVGSPLVQPIRLLCFAYDAATGKYTLMTMRLVRAAGLFTALALGFLVVRALRRERQVRQTASTPGLKGEG